MSLTQRIAERVPEVINDVSIGAKELIIAPAPDIISPAANNAMLTNTQIALLGVLVLAAGIVAWKAVHVMFPRLNLLNR